MRLIRITIKNFRRIEEADIHLAKSTFLIGQNNFGKSSAIRCLELLLSNESPQAGDFRKDAEGTSCDEIELTGYFEDISTEVANSRGFRGRVVNGAFCYRKTYPLANPSKPKIECREYPYSIREPYRDAGTGQGLIDVGLSEDRVREAVGANLTAKLKAGWERDLLDLVADFDMTAEPTWVPNPGGIPQNVISKLPRVIHVPPLTKHDDVGNGQGKTLVAEVLDILFKDLLEGNQTAETVQAGLDLLQAEMSPEREGSIIHTLCGEVNRIIGDVFPECGIQINPSLQDLAAVLRPRYEISLYSNVDTDVTRQGTGLLRTAIFSMFRYHTRLHERADIHTRPLLVAFEEPEMYLHPSAANLLRDTIYSLGRTDQIVCTTHSPWMIDLSQELQSLTKMLLQDSGYITSVNYGVSDAMTNLLGDDRKRVKMLQLFDDEMSRVFFAHRVVVVEGDSEMVALKATIALLPAEARKQVLSRVQIVKARGKAAIISLVKYLRALSIEPFVIHDRDQGTAGAEVFNPHILAAVGAPERVVMLEECIEHALGYVPPSADKPFHAYQVASGWADINAAPAAWKDAFMRAMELDEAALTEVPHENA
jgi:putative ATP-dependent endonuclease of the OLD family